MKTINDALIEAVKAAGGSKVVGALLWPEMLVEPAQRKLLDCLNPERAHRLSPEQAFLVLRLAKQAGQHEAMDFVCGYTGYTRPVPLVPVCEREALQRDFIAAKNELAALLAKLGGVA